MAKSNADFSRLVSSNKYILTPVNDGNSNSNKKKHNDASDSEISELKRTEKKRKRAERKKKYFDRKKATKEKQRAQEEEEEFSRQLKAKLSKSDNKRFEDLPEEYRKLIGGDFEHTHMVKGLDYGLLRQTKEKIAKQQEQDIENAYNDTQMTQTRDSDDETKNADGTGDISMIMNITSVWAHNIHESMMKYYFKKNCKPEDIDIKPKQSNINCKFCNGMIYKFDLDSDTSIPAEIMRSKIGYGLVLDDFNEFENDNIEKTVCSGYTPMETINKIKHCLNRPKLKDKEKVPVSPGTKRTFSEMNDIDLKAIDDDFDIFEDVGRDYVCDPEQSLKRRRVSFMTPTMEKMKAKLSYFESNKDVKNDSNVKNAAASILKSSLNKAKLENLKEKRRMKVDQQTIESGVSKDNERNEGNSLRGKLLSSGFSAYDDDIEDMNSYNSDDDDDKPNRSVTAAGADMEWKTMQEKFAKPGSSTSAPDSIKKRLNNTQNTPNISKFFG